MMTQLLEDLRFVIGAYFAIVSVALVVLGVRNPGPSGPAGLNLNLWSGIGMAVFAAAMLAMAGASLRASRRPAQGGR